MAGKMKGLILKEQGLVEVGERPIPNPGSHEALVRTTCVSTCNTDIDIIDNLIFPPAIGRFVGHEGIGIVEKVGSQVTYFKPGDRICVPAVTPSWNDVATQQGWPQFGDGGMAFEWCLKRDGVYGEYFCVKNVDMNCGKIPDNVTDTQAIMVTDMMATAWYGVENTEIMLGDSVVVFGVGPIGLCAIAAAKLKGAGRLVAIGTNPKGVKLAKTYGATDIVDYKKGDVIEQVRKLIGGDVDVSIIGGGTPQCFSQAIAMTRSGGNVCSLNAYYGDVVIPPVAWNSGMKTQKIQCWQVAGSREMFERYLTMISLGYFDPTPMVTHVYHGVDEMEKCIRMKSDRECIKPICILD